MIIDNIIKIVHHRLTICLVLSCNFANFLYRFYSSSLNIMPFIKEDLYYSALVIITALMAIFLIVFKKVKKN
jgi:hypothetical protein